jgi:hypothetical protein
MAATLINGINYSWGTVVIRALGSVFTGVTKISYKDAQEMENTYGAGNFPIGRGLGKITFEGSITLYKEELVALRSISPFGRIQNISEFDITVTYDVGGAKRVSDVLQGCRFMENGTEVASGDTKIEVDIPLAIGNINFGNSLV